MIFEKFEKKIRKILENYKFYEKLKSSAHN